MEIEQLAKGSSLSWQNDPRIVPYSVRLSFRTPSGGVRPLTLGIFKTLSESRDPAIQKLANERLGITVLCIGKQPMGSLLWTGSHPLWLTLPAANYVAVIKTSPDGYQAQFDMAVGLTPRHLLQEAIVQARYERRIAQEKDDEAEHIKRMLEFSACMEYLRLIKEGRDREAHLSNIEKEREERERTCKNCHAIAERALLVLILLEHALTRSKMSCAELACEKERIRRFRSAHPRA